MINMSKMSSYEKKKTESWMGTKLMIITFLTWGRHSTIDRATLSRYPNMDFFNFYLSIQGTSTM